MVEYLDRLSTYAYQHTDTVDEKSLPDSKLEFVHEIDHEEREVIKAKRKEALQKGVLESDVFQSDAF